MLPDVTGDLRLEKKKKKILWVESHGSLFVGHFPVAGKTRNEHSGFIRCGKFLDKPSDFRSFKSAFSALLWLPSSDSPACPFYG